MLLYPLPNRLGIRVESQRDLYTIWPGLPCLGGGLALCVHNYMITKLSSTNHRGQTGGDADAAQISTTRIRLRNERYRDTKLSTALLI
jgi:hypothetical protein